MQISRKYVGIENAGVLREWIESDGRREKNTKMASPGLEPETFSVTKLNHQPCMSPIHPTNHSKPTEFISRVKGRD
ncbi:unnamed protein product [Sphenostylis stenocarpa]|uniref:Uncharacterized protein n=1 Tax=Sphenostylis stenocarpa TaxID=92480 RepID=A0AA86SWT7_9FABA|nr:unnamed protein product [Sphenostylis stenocarpa]